MTSKLSNTNFFNNWLWRNATPKLYQSGWFPTDIFRTVFEFWKSVHNSALKRGQKTILIPVLRILKKRHSWSSRKTNQHKSNLEKCWQIRYGFLVHLYIHTPYSRFWSIQFTMTWNVEETKFAHHPIYRKINVPFKKIIISRYHILK